MAEVAKLEIKVDVDMAGAIAQLATLDAALNRIGGSSDNAGNGLRRLGDNSNNAHNSLQRMGNGITGFISGMMRMGGAAAQGAAQLLGFGEKATALAGPIGQAVVGLGLAGTAFGALGAIVPPIAGLIATTLPLGFIALGAAALSSDKEVSGAFNNMKTSIMDSVKQAAQPMKDELIKGMETLGETAKKLEGPLKEAFTGVAPLIKPIAEGISDMATNAMPGFNAAIKQSGPIMEGFKSLLGSIGTSAGNFFKELTKDKAATEGMKNALATLGKGLEKLGTIMGKAMADFAKNPENIKNLARAFELLGNAIKLVTSLANLLAPVFKVVMNVLNGIIVTTTQTANALRTVLGGAINWLKENVPKAWNAIKNATVTAWNAIVAAVKLAWEKVKTAVLTAVNWVKEKVLAAWHWIRDKSKEVWDKIVQFVKDAWEKIKNAILTAVNWVKEKILTAWNWIKDKSKEIWDKIVQFVKDAWEKIKNAVLTAVDWVKEKVKAAWDWIKDKTKEIWDKVVEFIKDAWEKIKTAVETAATWVKDKVKEAWDWIKDKTKEAWDKIIEFIKEAWEKIKTAIEDGVQKALEAIKKFIQDAIQTIKGAVGEFFQAGVAIIQGLIDGIMSMAGAVANAVGSVLSAARNLLPFSPAKEGPFSGSGWTYFSGASMMEGLADGIHDQSAVVNSAMNVAMVGAHGVLNVKHGSMLGGGTGAASAPANNFHFDFRGATVTGGQRQIEDMVVRALNEAKRKGRTV